MKIKSNYILKQMGKTYTVIAIETSEDHFKGMIRLNETGAFYWKEMQKGITEDELVKKMLERFTDLDETTARADLKEFIDSIAFALEKE